MAVARDHTARTFRPAPEAADGGEGHSAPSEPPRPYLAEESKTAPEAAPDPLTNESVPTVRERPNSTAPKSAAPKPARRKFILMGVVGLLALAAAAYGAH